MRVDPRSDRVAANLTSLVPPVSLAYEQGHIWALRGRTVSALDSTGHVTNQITAPVGGSSFAIAESRLWVMNNCGCRQGTLAEIALASKRLLATRATGETPTAIVADAKGAWVANFADGTLSRYRDS